MIPVFFLKIDPGPIFIDKTEFLTDCCVNTITYPARLIEVFNI